MRSCLFDIPEARLKVSCFDSTHFNSYKGGVFQEAASGVSYTDPTAYNSNGGNFQKFGFEYTTGPSGKITWSVGDAASWSMTGAAVGPNAAAGIGQRLISEEPMYVILNVSSPFLAFEWGQNGDMTSA